MTEQGANQKLLQGRHGERDGVLRPLKGEARKYPGTKKNSYGSGKRMKKKPAFKRQKLD